MNAVVEVEGVSSEIAVDQKDDEAKEGTEEQESRNFYYSIYLMYLGICTLSCSVQRKECLTFGLLR